MPDQICELFCGAGGMALGFAPFFEIAYAVDIRPEAVATYGANHPETDTRKRDVRNLTGCRGDFAGITGFIGGPPCQAWSCRNTRRVESDPRAHLIAEYLRLVEEIRPNFFVLENVTTVPAKEKTAAIRNSRALGYDITATYLNAADYGAAQTRRRWILIGTRTGTLGAIKPRRPRTVRDAFATVRENWGLMQSTPATLERLARAPTKQWGAMDGAGGYRNMIRLQWHRPAPTVCNPRKVYMVHPEEVRNISLAEAAALQGFPPGYIWKGNEGAIAQMVANAMPAEMAAAIAGALPGATVGDQQW